MSEVTLPEGNTINPRPKPLADRILDALRDGGPCDKSELWHRLGGTESWEGNLGSTFRQLRDAGHVLYSVTDDDKVLWRAVAEADRKPDVYLVAIGATFFTPNDTEVPKVHKISPAQSDAALNALNEPGAILEVETRMPDGTLAKRQRQFRVLPTLMVGSLGQITEEFRRRMAEVSGSFRESLKSALGGDEQVAAYMENLRAIVPDRCRFTAWNLPFTPRQPDPDTLTQPSRQQKLEFLFHADATFRQAAEQALARYAEKVAEAAADLPVPPAVPEQP